MSSVNPFPLIPEILDLIGVEEMLRAVLPKFSQRNRPGNSPTEPAFLDAFDQWLIGTSGSTQGLLNLVGKLRPMLDEQSVEQNIDWDFLENGIDALDFRLRQFEAVLHWARITWEYDPFIYQQVVAQIGPQTAEKDSKPEQSNVVPMLRE